MCALVHIMQHLICKIEQSIWSQVYFWHIKLDLTPDGHENSVNGKISGGTNIYERLLCIISGEEGMGLRDQKTALFTEHLTVKIQELQMKHIAGLPQ